MTQRSVQAFGAAVEGRPAAVRARGLAKRFGDLDAVAGVSLEIRQGECFGLLGPNGAGKTTIVRMLYGFTPITSGTAEVLGSDVSREPRLVRARTGVSPQEDNLDPDFSVLKNLLVYARYFGIPGRVARERARELLAFMGLEGKSRAKVETLSGGMKRRLVLARALVNDPLFLILDEPTTGLDPQARHQVWERVGELKGRGKTVLLTTHYMEEAERLCDRLAIMDHGKVVAEGSPDDLVARHVGREILEIWRPPEGLAARLREEGRELEEAPSRLFLITERGEEDLARIRAEHRPERCILRRANLEDVFLRLTGREFRD